MRPHAPRKKKKQAKKLKAGNDAMIMARIAMITAQSCVQIAIISSTPIGSAFAGEKVIKAALATMDGVIAVTNSMSDIKHWTYFVHKYRVA